MALKTTSSDSWSPTQAFALAAVSLLLGVSGGWMVRRSLPSRAAEPTQVASAPAPAPVEAINQAAAANLSAMTGMPSAQDLKQAADSQAAPLLEQLKSDPTNAATLAQLGNLYYDAKQYSAAIGYYERALKFQPSNSSVRTDMGTAYWYTGDADKAIAEFNQALSYEPTKADTLFNLGIVKWRGKKDGQGAIAAWQKLLDTNPAYANKDNVLQLIAQAQHR